MYDAMLLDEPARFAALERYEVLDTPPESDFDSVTALVRTILNVPASAVSLVASNRQWFKSILGLSVCETSREVSFCSYTIRSRQPLVICDATQDPRLADNPLVRSEPYIRSYLGVPLRTPDGYNVGTLCAIDFVPRQFDETQVAAVHKLAEIVIEKLELRLSNADQLTGALSRSAWLRALRSEVARFSRCPRSSAVVLFDLDHFKAVNDTFGHAAGDAVLRETARRSASLLRKGDAFGRLGGEEFAILLPETDADAALNLADKLRRQLASATMHAQGHSLTVTASFGICSTTESASGHQGLLASADAALYAAKARGRNQCCVAGAQLAA